MSGNIYIEPCKRKKKLLSKELKYFLEKINYFPFIVNESDLSYYQYLRDENIEDAEIIIEFIEKHGECEITIEY